LGKTHISWSEGARKESQLRISPDRGELLSESKNNLLVDGSGTCRSGILMLGNSCNLRVDSGFGAENASQSNLASVSLQSSEDQSISFNAAKTAFAAMVKSGKSNLTGNLGMNPESWSCLPNFGFLAETPIPIRQFTCFKESLGSGSWCSPPNQTLIPRERTKKAVCSTEYLLLMRGGNGSWPLPTYLHLAEGIALGSVLKFCGQA